MTIKIIGQHITQFGELWDKSLEDLLFEAVAGSIKNAGLEPRNIDAVFVANKAGGSFSSQRHLNAMASDWFAKQTGGKHRPPAFRIEGACASGGLAVLAAEHALLSGEYKTVLVVGVEKMTDVVGGKTTEILATAADNRAEYGSTFPALYAMLAKAYMRKFGTKREELSAIAVKNHLHALQNPQAQFHKKFTLEQVSRSTLVADPLRLLDCSPISDGAAAIVMTTKKSPYLAKIIGRGHAQDSLDLASRKSLTELKATRKAARKAFLMAKLQPRDIDYAEVHDCFTIAEILAVEDLGFFEKGKAGKKILEAVKNFDQKSDNGIFIEIMFKTSANKSPITNPKLLILNPSGGLKACGHPVGATGVKQLAYLSKLLSNNRGKKALAHNVGGSGATVVVHIVSS